MDESKELKAGMTATYEIGGKTVTLKPVTLGKMKKAMAVFSSGTQDPFDAMADHLAEILANGSNDFATREWIADNMTMLEATQVIEDSRKVNGMADGSFFRNGSEAGKAKREIRDLIEDTPTPSV